jgi:hypothetical protein
VDSIILTPGYFILQTGHTQALATYLAGNTSETVQPSGVTYTSSDVSIATVDGSGVVTGVAAGTVTISATKDSLVGYATIEVMTTACTVLPVATVLLLDRSLSMLAASTDLLYRNFLAVEKDLAAMVVNAIVVDKDQVGIVTFDASPQVLNSLGDTKAEMSLKIGALACPVVPDDQYTDLSSAVAYAFARVNECQTCEQKAVILMTDGLGAPALSDQDKADLLEACEAFKDADGVIIVVGMNAADRVYTFLRELASPGYFLNVTDDVAATRTALLNLPALYCSGVS